MRALAHCGRNRLMAGIRTAMEEYLGPASVAASRRQARDLSDIPRKKDGAGGWISEAFQFGKNHSKNLQVKLEMSARRHFSLCTAGGLAARLLLERQVHFKLPRSV